MARRKYKNGVNLSLSRTIIFSGVILLLAAFLLMRIDMVAKYVGEVVSVLRPVIIGVFLALILHTPKKRLELLLEKIFKKHPRFPSSGVAVLLSYLLFFAIIAGIVCIIVPQLADSVSEFADHFMFYFIDFQKYLQKFLGNSFPGQDLFHFPLNIQNFAQLKGWITNISSAVKEYLPNVVQMVGGWTSSLIGGITDIFIGLIFSVYILAGQKHLKYQAKRILKRFLAPRYYRGVAHYGNTLIEIFSNFLGGQLTDACILGMLCFIGLSIFRFPYAVLISVIIGLTNILPIVGPIIGTVPCAFILLMAEPKKVIWFLIFIVIIQQIDSQLVYPRVVGGSVGLPAIWVLFAIVVGSGLFGIVGTFFSVPVMSFIYVVLRENTLPKGAEVPETLQVSENAVGQKANAWFSWVKDTVWNRRNEAEATSEEEVSVTLQGEDYTEEE